MKRNKTCSPPHQNQGEHTTKRTILGIDRKKSGDICGGRHFGLLGFGVFINRMAETFVLFLA